jgi:hypothetical protein
MERLRRQLRNSSARVAQEAHLTHREINESTPREQLERMRRARQENGVFNSAFYRWSASPQDPLPQDPLSLQNENSFPDHVYSRDALDRRIAALIRPRE